ncbi:MAG: 4Fe-4S dicluster domain-containing protein [Synergistaceae bacterium]|nr:4Fe-4S dicluster domain-containing protein [Synergistaceae bacterium]MBP9958206.1 4Fe-4S dicluster domain-containing protein [Synergistaceae bacterium]
MSKYLHLSKTNCKHCYKCIRHCPVKAISFSSDSAHVEILPEDCILCGECYTICPQNAKSIRNDIDVAKGLIAGKTPVYASIAPSFIANYGGSDITALRESLLKLGFDGVFETAVGATVVKKKFDSIVESKKQDIVISSCCHSINILIQKYFPQALPYLAKVVSPMQAHSAIIKQNHPDSKIVFIGPCISKKAEAECNTDAPDSIDCVLTFGELSDWFAEENININTQNTQTEEIGGKARFFPTTGGILRSMAADSPDYSYVAIDGVKNCIETLKDIVAGDIDKCFIEMSACPGSCIGGPAMAKEKRSAVRDRLFVEKYALDAGGLDFHTQHISETDFCTVFKPNPVRKIFPGQKAIEEVLRSLGKRTPEDELNCGSCGYDTCKEKALAVLVGKADKTMCLPYLMEKAQSFSDNIISHTPNGVIVLNESLTIQKMNKAACRIMNVRDENDVLGMNAACVMDPDPLMHVLEERNNTYEKRVYMVEYQRYVMQTIIFDREYSIVIIIMRDITEEEIGRSRKVDICKQTIEITDKVIEKQMRSVQEIASLLGETTAETQIALTKLKETIYNEQFLH